MLKRTSNILVCHFSQRLSQFTLGDTDRPEGHALKLEKIQRDKYQQDP